MSIGLIIPLTSILILKFIGVDGALPFIVSGCLMAGAALPLLAVPRIENNHIAPAHNLVLRIVYMAPVAIGAGFLGGFLETAVLALLPVYGLHSGFETAYALVLVSLFSFCWFRGAKVLGHPAGTEYSKVKIRAQLPARRVGPTARREDPALISPQLPAPPPARRP